MAAKVPFDDRVNQQANISDLKLHLLQSFLQEIGSELYEHSSNLNLEELAAKMQIARGSKEFFKPLNVGLLFFNDRPEKFYRGALIEVITYTDEDGITFSEKRFTGPLQIQLREALSYIKTTVIEEHVRKIEGQAEALRFFNYPFQVIEEALANAVYHKSYEHPAAIEVNIRFNRIEILSFPGPLPPITSHILKQQLIVARNYRNRRIGDFLKEIHLTEGRSTGIPTMYKLMRQNGSPDPIFETDEDRNYFLTILFIHPQVTINKNAKIIINEPVNEPVNEPINEPVNDRQKEILRLIEKNRAISISELADNCKAARETVKRDLKKLKELNFIQRFGSDKAGYWELINLKNQ
jgi:ATP-dependent DNA helicase RecG